MSYETYELIHATGRVLRTGFITLLGVAIIGISSSSSFPVLILCGCLIGIVLLCVGLILFVGDMIDWFNHYSLWTDYETQQRKLRWESYIEKKLKENKQ